MTTVELPDGSIAEFPDTMTPDQIASAISGQQPSFTTEDFTSAGKFSPPGEPFDFSQTALAQDPVEFGAAFGETSLRKLADNLLNIGPATGDILAGGAALVPTVAESFTDQPKGFRERFAERLREEEGKFPASLLSRLPAPTSSDIVGFMTGDRGADVERAVSLREEQPVASVLGDIGGDVATVLTGKVPVASKLRTQRLQSPTAPHVSGVPNIKGFFSDKLNSSISKSLRSGGLNVAETTAEGAMLAALNDNDPITAAALSAGAQSGGSMMLSLGEGLLGNKGRNLVTAAAAGTALIQLFKSVTPGGRDRILESTESSFNKIAAALALGVMANVGGLNRPTDVVKDQLGGLAEALTTSRRGAVLSLLSDISNDVENNRSTVEDVVFKLAEDPSFFGPTVKRRVERALRSEDISVAEEIEKLAAADRKFFRQLNELAKPTGAEEMLSRTPTQQIRRQ